jgi:hypothetical protein
MLIFDRRAELKGQPGTHALIVGVSDYTYLPRYDEKADPKLDLKGLASSALSAFKIYEWLLERRDHLPVPLATCRLLLAPSDKERLVSQVGGLNDEVKGSPCGVDDFLLAANEWRADAQAGRDHATFFYFSGLGKELARSEPIILLQDFGRPIGPVLRGAVSVNNLLYGMSPNVRQPNIAQTQLFFVDSSRTPLPDLQSFELRNTTPVFDAVPLGLDERRASVFYASQAGGRAYAVRGQQTLFSGALLECLNGAAAVPAPVDSSDDRDWVVTTHSLINALGQVLRRLNTDMQKYNVRQTFEVGGLVRDAVVVRLDGPPVVPVRIEIDPPEVAPRTVITIQDETGKPIKTLTPPREGGPVSVDLTAGVYLLEAKTAPPAPGPMVVTRVRLIKPPRVEWKVRVSSGADDR